MNAKPRILFLDDEPDLCEIFRDVLDPKYAEVRAFTDPEAAVRDAHENPPDIAVLDFRLPSTTGDEIARRLPAGTKVVLLTGEISVNPEFPFAHVVYKPADYDVLIDLLFEGRVARA